MNIFDFDNEVKKKLRGIEVENLDDPIEEDIFVEEEKEEEEFPEVTFGIVNTSKGLNLRKGPGTSFDVLALLKDGEEVEILGESGDFYNIKTDAGDLGFVMKKFIIT